MSNPQQGNSILTTQTYNTNYKTPMTRKRSGFNGSPKRRRDNGLYASCDNIEHNGDMAHKCYYLAEARCGVGEMISQEVRFPMVGRPYYACNYEWYKKPSAKLWHKMHGLLWCCCTMVVDNFQMERPEFEKSRILIRNRYVLVTRYGRSFCGSIRDHSWHPL
jgi:hypothetical protein